MTFRRIPIMSLKKSYIKKKVPNPYKNRNSDPDPGAYAGGGGNRGNVPPPPRPDNQHLNDDQRLHDTSTFMTPALSC